MSVREFFVLQSMHDSLLKYLDDHPGAEADHNLVATIAGLWELLEKARAAA